MVVDDNGANLCGESQLMEKTSQLQMKNLMNGLKVNVESPLISITADDNKVTVRYYGKLLCEICVLDNAYRIAGVSEKWAGTTSYHCGEFQDFGLYYYVDSMDECIGEVERLCAFEKEEEMKLKNLNQLKEMMSVKSFENAYQHFIEQADKNAISGKGEGSRKPYGFSTVPACIGKQLNTKYGQGAASSTPYMNWWVVSIYYTPKTGDIKIGIEEERYLHLQDMSISPVSYELIGNKKVRTAIFYSTTTANLDYAVLYEEFLKVVDDVVRLEISN